MSDREALRKNIIEAKRNSKTARGSADGTVKFKSFTIPDCWKECVRVIENLPERASSGGKAKGTEAVDSSSSSLLSSYCDDAYYRAAVAILDFTQQIIVNDPNKDGGDIFLAKVSCLDEAIALEPRFEELHREKSILAHSGFLRSRGSPQYKFQFKDIEEIFKQYVRTLTLRYQQEEERKILTRFASKPPLDLSDDELKLFRPAVEALVRLEFDFFYCELTENERENALPPNWLVPAAAEGTPAKSHQEEEQQKMVQIVTPGFKLGGLLLVMSGLKPSVFVMYPPIENFATRWDEKVLQPWMKEFRPVLDPLGMKGDLIQLSEGNMSEVLIIHRGRVNPEAAQAVDDTLKKVHAISSTNRSWISDRFNPPVPSGPVKVVLRTWNRGSFCLDALQRGKTTSSSFSSYSSKTDDSLLPISLQEFSFDHCKNGGGGEEEDAVSVVQAAAAALNYLTAFAAAGLQVTIALTAPTGDEAKGDSGSGGKKQQQLSPLMAALFFVTVSQGVLTQCDLYFRLGIFGLNTSSSSTSAASNSSDVSGGLKLSDVLGAIQSAAKIYGQFAFQER